MIEYINQTLINPWSMCPERVRRRWIEGEVIPPGVAAWIKDERNVNDEWETVPDFLWSIIEDYQEDFINRAIYNRAAA